MLDELYKKYLDICWQKEKEWQKKEYTLVADSVELDHADECAVLEGALSSFGALSYEGVRNKAQRFNPLSDRTVSLSRLFRA